MMRCAIFALALGLAAGASLIPTQPAHATFEGPWCAQINMGARYVVERCHFQTFEACQREIAGLSTSFCNNNPRYHWNDRGWRSPEQAPRRKMKRPRHSAR